MKTTDLIPLILHQLIDEDKYGYDIVKKIEEDSNGVINIKQPTLYSLLKKLEQSRFITSYWKDSEIGGKRHYYKITENGKAQVSTYPSYENLIAECSGEATSPTPSPIPNEVANLNLNQPSTDNSVSINPIAHATEMDADTRDKFVDSDALPDVEAVKIDINTATEFSQMDNDTPVVKPIDLLSGMGVTNSQFDNYSTTYEPYSPIGNSQTEIFESIQSIENMDISKNVSDEYIGHNYQELGCQNNDMGNTSINTMPEQSPVLANIFDAIEPDSTTDVAISEDENLYEQEQANTIEQNFDTPNIDLQANTISNVEDLSPTPVIEVNINPKLAEQVTSLDAEAECKTTSNEVKIIDHDAVPYINYVNLKTDGMAIIRRKMLKAGTIKMTLSSFTLLIILAVTLSLAVKTSFTRIYCVCIIVAGLILIFYPLLFAKSRIKLKIKYCTKPLEYNVFMDFFVKLSLFLILAILIFAYNLSICYQFADIFKFDNVSNLLSPLLLSATLLLDFIYSYICFKHFKIRK